MTKYYFLTFIRAWRHHDLQQWKNQIRNRSEDPLKEVKLNNANVPSCGVQLWQICAIDKQQGVLTLLTSEGTESPKQKKAW